MAKITRKGYGQLELNQVAFRRDGHVEAQTPYEIPEGNTTYENGMILVIDKAKGVVRKGVDGDLYGIVYTSEEMYDNNKALKNFGVEVVNGEINGTDGFNVLPRLGILTPGDVFTTNTVDGSDFTKGAKAYISATGEISTTEQTAGPVLIVEEDKATMPDGQPAIRFAVIKG